MKKRALSIEDLIKISYVSSPDVSPEGTEVAYVLKKARQDTGGFLSKIRITSIGGEEEIRLNDEKMSSEDLPKYSPDGRWLAYLSDSSDENQIWILDRMQGNSRQLTTLRNGVIDYNWSPNSQDIVFTTKMWPLDEEQAFVPMSREEKERKKAERETEPMVVEDLMYKFDHTYGMIDGSYEHIGVVDLERGKATILTKGTTHYFKPVWSSDGKQIAFFGRPYLHAKATKSQLFICNKKGEQMKQLTEEWMIQDTTPAVFTKDGQQIMLSKYQKNEQSVYEIVPIVFSINNNKEKPLIKASEQIDGVGGYAMVRTQNGRLNPPLALSDQDQVLWVLSCFKGTDTVYRFDVQEQQGRRITPEKGSVHSFCPPVDGKLVYIRGEGTTLAEVYVLDLTNGTEKRLTYSNPWINEVLLEQPAELKTSTKDGSSEIQGFVYESQNREEGLKAPVILYIHGGPEISYGHDFWFEAHYLASKGFGVVLCDPRGSGGYGSNFRKNGYSWGKESMEDLDKFLEVAVETYQFDLERAGVTGGSYGGHMTNRMIGSSNRFKAAVTQRTLCNLATSYGTGDMGFVQTDQHFTTMLKMLTDRAKGRSTTLRMIDQIETPLLILHGTEDYRCSFEQAEQFFIAMKDRRPEIPVRLVAFPGENHEITRTGNTFNQMYHLKEIVSWFELYLSRGGNDEKGV